MSSVCFYFQVHQPFRLRRFSYFDSARAFDYFDEHGNREILQKVARKCYLPANDFILRLIEKYHGKFRVAYSITGVAIDQFRLYSPETLASFKRLAETGCVEFLGETYYHSLASLYDEGEFDAQIRKHTALMQDLFGYTPQVFRNTELIYNDHIGQLVAKRGYKGMIAEGVDDVLDWRSPNFVYQAAAAPMALLLKNYRLSDDIAFRFSNQGWSDFPLTADKFASWVHRISGTGETVNLFMDYETFGEHQWETTGIFQFLDHLPDAILQHPHWDFATPSEVIDRYPRRAEIPFHRTTSWADIDRDLTAWRGNRMQTKALHEIYALADAVHMTGSDAALETWRRLQTSDHYYYMCTKFFADGDVHAYFSPFESPYDAFLNYENVFKDFTNAIHATADERRRGIAPSKPPAQSPAPAK